MPFWHLNYPIDTEETANVVRHHLALLRDDVAVDHVEAWEDPEAPGKLFVRVAFRDRCSRPDRTELQALDQMYSDDARHERAAKLIRLQRGENLKKTWYEHILGED